MIQDDHQYPIVDILKQKVLVINNDQHMVINNQTIQNWSSSWANTSIRWIMRVTNDENSNINEKHTHTSNRQGSNVSVNNRVDHYRSNSYTGESSKRVMAN